MRKDESKLIVVRSRKQPFVVFALLGTPILILTLYTAVLINETNGLVSPAVVIFMFGLIFYYFYSLKLVMMNDHLIYQEMWRSADVHINDVLSVERGYGPFGVGVTWVITCKDRKSPIVANVTNFDSKALHNFAKALLGRAPGIRFSALQLSSVSPSNPNE